MPGTGTLCRIIDYITTTQNDTRSVGNQFDVIVEELTETLGKEATLCLHEGVLSSYQNSLNIHTKNQTYY